MSEIRFEDQVVLVTGAGRGLGAAYARAFAARGANVVVHDAGVERDGSGGDPSVAHDVADEIGGAPCVENLETEDGCRRTVEFALERFGRLDAVIQNAGLNVWEELEEADRSWERMRRVNVDAPFHITRAAFSAMKKQGYGRFVFTTSGRAMAVDRTRPGLAAYVFLASSACTFTGKVLEAAGGEFDVARWTSSDEVDFGREPVEPEVIAERWQEIEGVVQA
jgi:NAD(P)-dependent dehydrogenase (short-subunit alcohol dehydrogenase family)